jgi:hypothetical protein
MTRDIPEVTAEFMQVLQFSRFIGIFEKNKNAKTDEVMLSKIKLCS